MSKNVVVEDETWTRLTILKAKILAESLDTVIVKLLNNGEKKILDDFKNR